MGKIADEMGVSGEIEAEPYKFLLYEKGCFFRRHRDTERSAGMFGTLVVQLPSVFEGADLRVWSPLTPDESPTVYKMPNPTGLEFAAFYCDCYHEVTNVSKPIERMYLVLCHDNTVWLKLILFLLSPNSQLTAGLRCALIFNLVVRPGKSKIPPQPADQSVAAEIAKMLSQFERETDNDYPDQRDHQKNYAWRGKEEDWPGKPNKLVVFLSHAYTKKGLREAGGLKALKNNDRAIAGLLAAAMGNSTRFDAVVTIARIADMGEGTCEQGCETDGEIFPLVRLAVWARLSEMEVH